MLELASTTGSAGSPSKNLAIAIYKYHEGYAEAFKRSSAYLHIPLATLKKRHSSL